MAACALLLGCARLLFRQLDLLPVVLNLAAETNLGAPLIAAIMASSLGSTETFRSGSAPGVRTLRSAQRNKHCRWP